MNLFTSVAGRKTPKSKVNLSHSKKLALGLGDLIPTYFEEILPGDKLRMKQEIMVRMSPMIAPIMHEIDIFTHYFFIPNRLVWDGWEDFITGGTDGLVAPEKPYVTLNETNRQWFQPSSLPDFLGYPTIEDTDPGITVEEKFDSLPLRAAALVYNEYFRDQTLSAEIPINKDQDGSDDDIINFLALVAQRKWAKDYFTSALPWAQRGAEAIINSDINYKPIAKVLDQNGDEVSLDGDLKHADDGDFYSTLYSGLGLDNIDNLGITINSLRQSTRLQEWLERQARAGSRLTETILSHFGIMGKDSRLQRPEFLGGSKNPISVSEVLNTTGIIDDATGSASGGDVQGAMAGHGIGVGANNGFKRSFDEHGFVIGFTSVVPKRNYQQMAPRKLQRFDKFSYYWPEFANLGEQEIKAKELFFDPTDSTQNDSTWGYTPRYSEYKFNFNTVHGKFKNNLSHWHLGEIFEDLPQLTGGFLNCRPSNRIFAVTEDRNYLVAGEELYCNIYNRVDAVRPMPYYGTPRL